MDHPDSGSIGPIVGFPRPRGDGPPARRPWRGGAAVSPPTRGWTEYIELIAGGVVGFPAHAGMDPDAAVPEIVIAGFPRPRGDGPSQHEIVSAPCRVSPPTRGWTRRRSRRRHPGRGFPAHAGMDPCQEKLRELKVWFPRPRGDGPRSRIGVPDRYPVSPPTRGWTYWRDSRLYDIDGFPAHAGMDPTLYDVRNGDKGFPRPRGDGPNVIWSS